MLKILFIAQNIPLPGRESNDIIFKLANYLSGSCNVNFLYPSEYTPFFLRNVKKYRFNYRLKDWENKNHAIKVYKYWRLPFKKLAFWMLDRPSSKQINIIEDLLPLDICHAHYILPDGFIAYMIKKRFNIPYIITVRGSDLRLLKRGRGSGITYDRAFDAIFNASKIIVLNKTQKEFIENMFDRECEIVPHGIEEEYISSEFSENAGNMVRIVTAGSMLEQKNHHWAIEFVKSYKGPKDVSLVLIGTGPYLNELKTLAGGDSRIIFTGRLERRHVIDYLRNSDIFSMPSVNESFGRVFIEAAANYNAVIGHVNEGVWGVFSEGDEMLFAKDKQDYFTWLGKLVDNDKLRNDLALKAHNRATQVTWSKIITRYRDIYNNVIN